MYCEFLIQPFLNMIKKSHVFNYVYITKHLSILCQLNRNNWFDYVYLLLLPSKHITYYITRPGNES